MEEIADVTVPKLEGITPEINKLEAFSNLFRRLGAITSKSRIRNTESDRPFSLLAKRAELHKEVTEARGAKDTKKTEDLLHEAHMRDEIAKQYLTQGEVTIDMGELGKQTARYVEVKPPAERNKNLPTIFLIPGISNDIDCVGWLIQELAWEGRTVVCAGFPESHMGKTTEAFARAVKDSKEYGPHSQLFSAELKTLIPDGEVELWGQSTGVPILEQILQDPEIQKRVTRAVGLNPASSVDQTLMSLYSGTAREAAYLAGEFKNLPKYTLSGGRREMDGIAKNTPQAQLNKEVMNTLLERVRTKMDLWKTAKVKEGGTITIVSGDKDFMTRSSEEFTDEAKFQVKNPQMRVVRLPECHHSTVLIHPEEVLDRLGNIS
jgi:pimeloyl-ACP methyl ester carboxylesterase